MLGWIFPYGDSTEGGLSPIYLFSYNKKLFKPLNFNRNMPRDNVRMPSGMGGLVRYFDDYKSKIDFRPHWVVVLIIAVIIIEMVLHFAQCTSSFWQYFNPFSVMCHCLKLLFLLEDIIMLSWARYSCLKQNFWFFILVIRIIVVEIQVLEEEQDIIYDKNYKKKLNKKNWIYILI